MKNIILADCKKEQVMDFCRGLEEETKTQWSLEIYISNWGRMNSWLKIKRYLVYFYVPFKVFLHRKNYNIIIGWQQFYALILAFYCRFFNVKKEFSIYVINFTYKDKKGILGKIYFCFMKYILQSKYIDGIYLPSTKYIDFCIKKLDIDKEKFCVVPFGIPDLYRKYQPLKETNEYILAIGRSNRDYDWLINEWRKINIKLYIISDEYKPTINIPNNIEIINNISGEKQYPYILGCKLLILPIKDSNICSGDTVLLTAMSFKKTVIITTPSTLSEMYIKNRINGLLVEKVHGELKKLIDEIEKENINLGENARKSYKKFFSRFNMGKKVGNFINLKNYS